MSLCKENNNQNLMIRHFFNIDIKKKNVKSFSKGNFMLVGKRMFVFYAYFYIFI